MKESRTKSERTRARILEAAAEVLARRGYADARLEDIAAAAQTLRGSLYYHFDSREELVAEVLEVALKRVDDAVRARLQALPRSASYRTRVTAAIETQLVMALGEDAFAAATFRVAPYLPAPLRQRYARQLRRFVDSWRDLLVRAQEAGEVDPKFDLSLLRMTLLGAIYWTLEWYRPSGAMTPPQIAAQIADLFFEGVLPRSGRARAVRRAR
jgi:AcrR family transcriptional regulator